MTKCEVCKSFHWKGGWPEASSIATRVRHSTETLTRHRKESKCRTQTKRSLRTKRSSSLQRRLTR